MPTPPDKPKSRANPLLDDGDFQLAAAPPPAIPTSPPNSPKPKKAAEIDALRCTPPAARKDRYWRAAARLLERKNPQDFASRPPTLFTGDEVYQFISRIIETLHDEIPDENCDRVLAKLEEMIEACRVEHTSPTFPTSPGPELTRLPPSPRSNSRNTLPPNCRNLRPVRQPQILATTTFSRRKLDVKMEHLEKALRKLRPRRDCQTAQTPVS
jgi:hypothetical protein